MQYLSIRVQSAPGPDADTLDWIERAAPDALAALAALAASRRARVTETAWTGDTLHAEIVEG
jgi:hypothetical protein